MVLRDSCVHTYRYWVGTKFQYKEVACPYVAEVYFKKNGEPTMDPAEDSCGKRLSDCKLRFGVEAVLPRNGIPWRRKILMIDFEIDLELIREQAKAAYPNEAVWLLTEKGGLYQVDNVHEQPSSFFKVSAHDSMVATMEGLKAVIHSHCDGYPVPSAEDMQLFDNLRIPCGIETMALIAINWLTASKALFLGTALFSLSRLHRLKGDVAEPRNWWVGKAILDDF